MQFRNEPGSGGPDVTIRAPNSPAARAFVDSGRNGRKGKAMRLQRITNGLTCTTAAAALALLLTACGPSQPASQGSAEPGNGPPSASGSQPRGPETSAPSSSSASTSASTSASASTPSKPLRPARLQAPGHVRRRPTMQGVRAESHTDATGGGAAGSVYMELILTNSGNVRLPSQGLRRCLADQRPQRPADRGAGAARHVGSRRATCCWHPASPERP